MTRLLLPPNGFLSYVRDDDELTGHRISQLCEAIRKSLQFHLGQNVDIFQDTTEIGHGAHWKKRTEKAIADASFFIPILTPAYLNSSWCGWELRQFSERERALISAHPVLAGASLIFPINLTSVDETDPDGQGLFDELQQLQHLAFGDLLYGNFDQPPARTAITRYVADIRTLLRTPLDTVASPPPPPTPAPEPVETVLAPTPESKPPRAARPRQPKPGPVPTQPPPPLLQQQPEQPPEQPAAVPAPGGPSTRDKKRIGWALAAIALLVAVVIVANRAQPPSPTNIPANVMEVWVNGVVVERRYENSSTGSYETDNAGNVGADTGGNSPDIEINTPGI